MMPDPPPGEPERIVRSPSPQFKSGSFLRVQLIVALGIFLGATLLAALFYMHILELPEPGLTIISGITGGLFAYILSRYLNYYDVYLDERKREREHYYKEWYEELEKIMGKYDEIAQDFPALEEEINNELQKQRR